MSIYVNIAQKLGFYWHQKPAYRQYIHFYEAIHHVACRQTNRKCPPFATTLSYL
jgi:hypothetical protein